MKKLLFLLFGALFALAGCADESGTNGGNTETCPITSADFSYEEIAVNKYKLTLINKNKRQYFGGARWALYNDNVAYDKTNNVETTITFFEPDNKKELIFYYNNNQCGDTVILKPTPANLNSNCDNILINYLQQVNYANPSSFYVQFKDINQLDNNLKYTIKFTDNKTLEREPETVYNSSIVFRAMYSEIEHLISYFPSGNGGIFADLIIDYPDGSQCIKEIFFDKMF